jgi:hypothetical protein
LTSDGFLLTEQDNKTRSVTLCVTPRCNAVKNRESRITIPLLRGGKTRRNLGRAVKLAEPRKNPEKPGNT